VANGSGRLERKGLEGEEGGGTREVVGGVESQANSVASDVQQS
jgi:hypothetical protein